MTEAAAFYDVVVVGAGMAGCAAALSAAEAGAQVLLVEKMPEIGGSSLLSAGAMAFAGTPVQAAAGVHDDKELLRADLLRMGGGHSDPELVAVYVDNQLATFEWLVGHGVGFSSLQVGSGNSVPRTHRVQTAQALAALRTAFEAYPDCLLLTGTRAMRLRRDNDHSSVRAVLLDDGPTVRVRHGIVLTSGGFSRNRELVARFAPSMLNATAVGGEGSTGDGLLLACALGAGLRDMGFIRATFGSHPEAAGARNLILHAIFKGAIIVNTGGRRFVNESLSYKDIGDACLAQRGALGYQVFDARVMARSDPNAGNYDFQRARSEGRLLESASLAGLAPMIGVAEETLQRTVSEYNEVVDGDRQDFLGRTTLPGGAPLSRIGMSPFYAYPSTSILLSTYCGLTIDTQARVLDVFGSPIPGLYAAGEIFGGLHGANYVSGSSVGKAAIFGRLAGRGAAEFRPPQHEWR